MQMIKSVKIQSTVMAQSADDELMIAEQVAALLSISLATVRQWTSQRRIPYVKLSRKVVRYSPKALKELIQSKTFTERRDESNENQSLKRRRKKMSQSFSPCDVDNMIARAKRDTLDI